VSAVDGSDHPYAKGDEVKVFCQTGQQPPGGWDGTIAKVGRSLVYIDYPGARGGVPQAFSIETRKAAALNSLRRFDFPAAVEAGERRWAAEQVLRRHDLHGRGATELPVEVLEALAEVLAEYEQPGQQQAAPVAYEPMQED
jgi:hypothetical protein